MGRRKNKRDRKYERPMSVSRSWALNASSLLAAEEVERQFARELAEREERWAKEEAEAPVFFQAVNGYRAWKIDAFGDLRPITATSQVWTPGVNTAVCDGAPSEGLVVMWGAVTPQNPPEAGHASPQRNCHCGLYGWSDAARVVASTPSIYEHGWPTFIGSIAAWGRMYVHYDGFRAEHACVTSLVIPDGADGRLRDLIERVAERYRVRTVAFGELEAEACRHGQPLPENARPERPQPVTLHDQYPATLSHSGSSWSGWVTYSTSAKGGS